VISLNWVKDYLDLSGESIPELTKKITEFGVNIESVKTYDIKNLVVGEVLECVPHPDSDHLHVTKINVGNETLQIVCGAPNMRQGLKVIVAKVGAILPGDFEIKKSTIRGVESNGMCCALFELGLEPKTEENYAKGIHELPADAPVGEDALTYLGLDDTILDLDYHKHRNNDCYYHIGFAYLVGAILNRKVKLPSAKTNPIKDNIKDHFSLKVETPKCPYYLAKMVTNIKIGESPDFIKKRLIAVGMRPINNVVDISNYVMLEYGQPMHFFDKDKLGDKIVVRDAKDNEEIITLDKQKRILSKNDIVITDGNKPVCIAGVMGGENTEVDLNTKTILIESAIFDAISIRYTAKNLNLPSEASLRYGKGLNYEYTASAIERACSLLEEYAGATVLSGTIKHDTLVKKENIITFTSEEVNNLLGLKISSQDMEHELDRLEFPYTLTKDKFKVTIPNRRLDIDPNVNDIAEEIVKLYGYHNLVSTLPIVETKEGGYVGDVKYRKLVSKRLRSLGLNECKTYTLTSPSMAKTFNYDNLTNINLPNPMSMDKSIIRTTILPSLLNVYNYNKDRKVENINIYEISKTYDLNYVENSKIALLMSGNYLTNGWNTNTIKVDFYVLKGIIENILIYLGFKNRYTFVKEELPDLHPGICARIYLDREPIGIIGKVHPNLTKDNIYVAELSLTSLMRNIKPIKYKKPSIYPGIAKDVAFIVDKDITSETLEKDIKKASSKILTDIKIFDVYTGTNVEENKKSIAFNLTFNDPTRTLTDEEVMQDFNKIIDYVTTKDKAILRDK
jgi:phenylalanyl-tRNA synthetase beta chain